MASHETIHVHIDGAAATIELNRPDALNAWNLWPGPWIEFRRRTHRINPGDYRVAV